MSCPFSQVHHEQEEYLSCETIQLCLFKLVLFKATNSERIGCKDGSIFKSVSTEGSFFSNFFQLPFPYLRSSCTGSVDIKTLIDALQRVLNP